MKDQLQHKKLRNFLRGKRVAVLGAGVSGISAVRLLLRLGARVFLSDNKDSALPVAINEKIEKETSGHSDKILQSDLIILSPGVSCDIPVLKKARGLNIPIWGELELGWRLLSADKVLAVTGTNGKTTTVYLLYAMLRRQYQQTLLAGNVGAALTQFVDKKWRAVVLEVSSYQLEGIDQFHPQACAVLNLTSDHLHRHKTMAGYAKAKARIFKNQTVRDRLILNAEDAYCVKMQRSASARVWSFSQSKKKSAAIYWDAEKSEIISQFNGQVQRWPRPTHLLGMHNIENAMAAIALAVAQGVQSKFICAALRNFKGVAHRLQVVSRKNNVLWINDSKATNVDSTLKALDALSSPLWLILGGEDKGSPYLPIRKKILARKNTSAPVLGCLLIGEAAPLIRKELSGVCPLYDCRDMAGAVAQAQTLAQSEQVVLLSPACASFDQYKNFEERGRHFGALVKGKQHARA